jgi:hypothetical protein
MTMLPFDNNDQVSLDGENAPDESGDLGDLGTEMNPPIPDEDDAPLTDADLAHAKHAAAVATGQASVAPPPIEAPAATDAPRQRNRRKDAGQPRAPRKPKSGDPVSAEMLAPPSDVQVSITLNPIDGKLTAEAINKAAASQPEPRITGHQEIISTSDAQVVIDHKSGQALYVGNKEPGIPCHDPPNAHKEDAFERAAGLIVEQVEREVFADTTSDRQLGSNDIDTKSIARARLKVYGKFAARARTAAQLWPKDPVRYFDTVGKIFTDLAHGECRIDALRYDRAAVAELVIGLLPKATIEVIDCSGITNI